jgi:hypothetical protein
MIDFDEWALALITIAEVVHLFDDMRRQNYEDHDQEGDDNQ